MGFYGYGGIQSKVNVVDKIMSIEEIVYKVRPWIRLIIFILSRRKNKKGFEFGFHLEPMS